MLSCAWALLWGLALFAAWMGWGQLLHLTLFRRRAPLLLTPAYGIAGLLAVGGYLNLLSACTPPAIYALCAIGWLALAATLAPRRRGLTTSEKRPRDAAALLLLALVLAVLALRYLASAVTPIDHYSIHDDLQAYALFPIRIVQTGALGDDPFNERRLFTYGGIAFLEAMHLAPTTLLNLSLPDLGLGWIAFTMAAAHLLATLRWPARRRYGLLLAIALFPPSQADVNLSGCLLPATLILLLALLLIHGLSRPHLIAAAVVAAALCSMKATLVAPVSLTIVAFIAILLFQPRQRPAAVLAAMLVFGFVFLVVILPWAVALHHSSATLLYPVLGKGVHATGYGFFKPPIAALTLKRFIKVCLVAGLPAFLLIGLLWAWRRFPARDDAATRTRIAAASLFLGALGGAFAIGIATAGSQMERHLFGFYASCLLFALLALHSCAPGQSWTSWLKGGALAIALCFAAMLGMNAAFFPETARGIGFALHPPVPDTAMIARTRAMQAAIPEGQPLLTRLAYPIYLDFARNPLFVADWPGITSPRPGMPVFHGPDALANYLLEHQLPYLAYSYADDAHFAPTDYAYRLEPSFHLWIRNQAQATLDFQDNVEQLARTHRHVFDDGYAYVLDLSKPAATTGAVGEGR
jgi:hypothetical protein